MRLSKNQLQAALDSLASANNRAQVARDKIMQHCQLVYGVDPGDVDNDAFIDACDGGCGSSSSMSVAEFDESMRAAMSGKGIVVPSTAKTK